MQSYLVDSLSRSSFNLVNVLFTSISSERLGVILACRLYVVYQRQQCNAL